MSNITCDGCEYENVDLRSSAVSNFIGCKRICENGRYDNFKPIKVRPVYGECRYTVIDD